MSTVSETPSKLKSALREAIERGDFRSQSEFARKCSVNESQMSRYLHGTRPHNAGQRKRIARKLGKSPEEIWPG